MSKLKHVAIIMDGNGRWAQKRFRPRVWGHVRGAEVVSAIVEEAKDCGLRSLTVYAFSTENWQRPEREVSTLLKLLKKFLLKERARILRNDIKFKVMGDRSKLPKDVLPLVQQLELETLNAKGLMLNFAFNYGGRSEILNSINSFIEKRPGEKISESDFIAELYVPEIAELDLLIRTGGDQRISNFLLWQVAYAELFFTETLWPDFGREEFKKIIETVGRRERRFGKILQGA